MRVRIRSSKLRGWFAPDVSDDFSIREMDDELRVQELVSRSGLSTVPRGLGPSDGEYTASWWKRDDGEAGPS